MRYDGLTEDSTKGALRNVMDKLAMLSDQKTLAKVDNAINSIVNPDTKPDANGVKTSSCGGKKRVKRAGMDFNPNSDPNYNPAGDPIMKSASLADLMAAGSALDAILEKKKF